MHFSPTDGRWACKGPETKHCTGQQACRVCRTMPHGSAVSIRRWTWK